MTVLAISKYHVIILRICLKFKKSYENIYVQCAERMRVVFNVGKAFILLFSVWLIVVVWFSAPFLRYLALLIVHGFVYL